MGLRLLSYCSMAVDGCEVGLCGGRSWCRYHGRNNGSTAEARRKAHNNIRE